MRRGDAQAGGGRGVHHRGRGQVMDRNTWIAYVPTLRQDRDRAARALVLEPGASAQELAQAQAALTHPLPEVVLLVLRQWGEQGADLLLHTIPQVLNSLAPAKELNPTGQRMERLFPAWCEVLRSTEQCAVILDTAGQEEPLLVGGARQVAPAHLKWSAAGEGLRTWGYRLPQPLRALVAQEAHAEYALSPQMRQWYARVWGAADLYVCPYLERPEELVPGALYGDIYRDLVDQIPLLPDTVRQLKQFVFFFVTPTGDFIGYFSASGEADHAEEEPAIQWWNHETARFALWAPDFAGAVARIVGEAF
jgi:hypothetical protein